MRKEGCLAMSVLEAVLGEGKQTRKAHTQGGRGLVHAMPPAGHGGSTQNFWTSGIVSITVVTVETYHGISILVAPEGSLCSLVFY